MPIRCLCNELIISDIKNKYLLGCQNSILYVCMCLNNRYLHPCLLYSVDCQRIISFLLIMKEESFGYFHHY